MAFVKYDDIEYNQWYRIGLFSDKCEAYGRTIAYFEAKFDGEWWVDKNNVTYSVFDVIFIDDELAW